MDITEDYGTCCVCESEMDECVLIQLDYKVESESGWGCLVCDLPMEGAMAVVCADCFDEYDDDLEDKIKFLMNGIRGRIPVPPPESRIKHEHNLMYHPKDQDAETLWE